MQDRLHGVDDQRARRVFGEFDDALQPQQPLAMRRAQQVEEHLDRRERQRPVMRERTGLHPRIVAAVMVVIGMPGMIVVVVVP